MKKFFSFAVAILASVSMFAQTEVGAISILPKVGVNLATVTGDLKNKKMKVDFTIGAEAAYQLTDALAVSGGLLYSGQGVKQKHDDETETCNLSYLNIPLLANYYVIKGLAVKAGIQPGFLLSAKEKDDNSSEDIKSRCNSFDFAIPVGLSYEISNVVIDARYNIGLTKIYKNEDGHKARDYKNSVFQITVGYKF